jgi:acetyl-CoA synthetase
VLAFKQPWPSMARTVWGAHKRYMETYLTVYKGYYFTGDGAGRDHEGYYWIRGRVDDVVNVSGHRLSTAEIEAALLEHRKSSRWDSLAHKLTIIQIPWPRLQLLVLAMN